MRRSVTRRFTFVESLVVIATLAVLVAIPFVFFAQAGQAAASRASSVSIVANGPGCAGEFCFEPASIRIRQAHTVTWTNRTSVEQTVTRCTTAACPGAGPGTGSDPAFNGTLGPGKTFSVTFHRTGTYNYYCAIHGFAVMHGAVTVQPFSVAKANLPGGREGQAYSAKLAALGGRAPFHWSIARGKMPTGVALGTSGVISGTPNVPGTFRFTVKVTDGSSPALTAARALSIVVR